MTNNIYHFASHTAAFRGLLTAALALGSIAASAQTVTPPPTPIDITPQAGNFALLGIKDGYVADQGAGVLLSSNSFLTVNLTNLSATVFLSGKVSDSASGMGTGTFTFTGQW